MTTKQWILSWIWTGLLGGAAMALDQAIRGIMPIGSQGGWAWALFIAWAGYTFAGANPRGGARVVAGYLLGILMSVAILEVGEQLTHLGFFASPVAIVLVVSLILSVEKGPELISLSSAIFLSGGTFFATMSYIPNATYTTASISVMLSCLLGCTFGALTAAGRRIITDFVAPKDKPTSVAHTPAT